MGQPTISVVIACRNEAQRLPQQLDALRNEEVDGWVDTVLVDDGSTDGTATVAEAHGRGLPGFRVIRTPPTNRATAINVGIRASTGEAVVLLDGDDVIAPGYLDTLQEAMADHPFVAARLDHEALNPEWLRTARDHQQVTELCHEPQRPWPIAGGGTLAAHRQVLDAIGGLAVECDYAQDTDLCWRLAMVGTPLTFVPAAVLHYRHRTTARTVFQQSRRYGRGGVLLDYRYGAGRSWPRVARRTLRLVAQVVRLPTLITRTGRVTTAFRTAFLLGWLEAVLWPSRFFPSAALVPVDGATGDGLSATRDSLT